MSLTEKIALFCLTILITMKTNCVLAQSVSLRVIQSAFSSVNQSNFLIKGDRFNTGANGLIDFELYPYKSIRIRVFPCTDGTITELRRYGDGVILNFSQRNKMFCPYNSSIKISSTLKDRNSSIKTSVKGRVITLNGTEANFTIDKGAILFGINKGSGVMEYEGQKSSVVIPGYFVKSKPDMPISNLIVSPPVYLKSIKTLSNGKSRVCTDIDNKLYSSIGNISYLLNNSRCLDTTVNDTMRVVTPTGLEQSYVFNP
jgi:hypothetical protein